MISCLPEIFFDVLPEIGRYDANYGLVMKGNGKGGYTVVPPKDSGFFVKGQVRDMKKVEGASGHTFIFLAKNKEALQVFTYDKKNQK